MHFGRGGDSEFCGDTASGGVPDSIFDRDIFCHDVWDESKNVIGSAAVCAGGGRIFCRILPSDCQAIYKSRRGGGRAVYRGTGECDRRAGGTRFWAGAL